MQSCLAQLGLWMVLATLCHGAGPGPRTRSFHLEYKTIVKDLPVEVNRLELWIPVPRNDPHQQIANVRVKTKLPYTLSTDSKGNKVLHILIQRPKESSFVADIAFSATRREHRQPGLYSGSPLAREEDSRELALWLKPDRLVPIDGQIRIWAREVVEAANAQTDLEMARAIYSHVVSTVKYDKTGRGWGRGDIYYACDARRGNCTDFHAIFIGYCRALGIPARFAIGFPLPADRGQGSITGYHCWAEFYAKGIGWIPIDASEAAKDPSRREYFFGAHDENRIEFTRGRDIVLSPRQKGDPLNYFVYPYAEVDGKVFAGTESIVTYRDQ